MNKVSLNNLIYITSHPKPLHELFLRKLPSDLEPTVAFAVQDDPTSAVQEELVPDEPTSIPNLAMQTKNSSSSNSKLT